MTNVRVEGHHCTLSRRVVCCPRCAAFPECHAAKPCDVFNASDIHLFHHDFTPSYSALVADWLLSSCLYLGINDAARKRDWAASGGIGVVFDAQSR